MANKQMNIGVDRISGTKLKINGFAGDPMRDLNIGEKVYVVAEIDVKKVTFDETPQGVVRLHTAYIWRYAEMDAEAAKDVLAASQEAAELATEDATGEARIFRGGFGNKPVEPNPDAITE